MLVLFTMEWEWVPTTKAMGSHRLDSVGTQLMHDNTGTPPMIIKVFSNWYCINCRGEVAGGRGLLTSLPADRALHGDCSVGSPHSRLYCIAPAICHANEIQPVQVAKICRTGYADSLWNFIKVYTYIHSHVQASNSHAYTCTCTCL